MATLKALVERIECAKGFRTYCIEPLLLEILNHDLLLL